jgi:hypothetical protein
MSALFILDRGLVGFDELGEETPRCFHIRTDDMERAMQWFQTDTFKEATRLAQVTGRSFYLAELQG